MDKYSINNNILSLRTARTHSRMGNQLDSGFFGKDRTDTDFYVAQGKKFIENKSEIEACLGFKLPTFDKLDKSFTIMTIPIKVDFKKMTEYYKKMKEIDNNFPELREKFNSHSLLNVRFPSSDEVDGKIEIYFKKNAERTPNKLHIKFIGRRGGIHKFIFDNLYGELSKLVFDFKNKLVWLDVVNDPSTIGNKISVKINPERAHLRKNWNEYKEKLDFRAALDKDKASLDFDFVLAKTADSLKRIASLQNRFKDDLIMEDLENKQGSCWVDGCAIKSEKLFMIASHIKPWAHCKTYDEATDRNNGILLCPNHDKLFDKGYISFTDTGELMISNKFGKEVISNFFINEYPMLNAEFLTERRKELLSYHHEYVFKK